MTTSTIYTFEREFASGGHIVGERLAQLLDIPFYDSQIVDLAAKNAGVNRKLFEGFDEKPTNSFLYSLVMGTYTAVNPLAHSPSLNISDRLFAEEAEIIRNAADQGPCVIVGRCSSYILRDRPNVARIFVTADLDFRIHHAVKDLGLPENRIEDEIGKRDKKRSNYFNYYTGQRWESASSYDLSVSTSKLGIDGAMEMVLAYGELLEKQRAAKS
ncbi:MAG: cytidylate kinase-like family protein [Eubacteriales bacterium]|nr:cytidylate kinase-like family protein [Eubacteriales bacterium]